MHTWPWRPCQAQEDVPTQAHVWASSRAAGWLHSEGAEPPRVPRVSPLARKPTRHLGVTPKVKRLEVVPCPS